MISKKLVRTPYAGINQQVQWVLSQPKRYPSSCMQLNTGLIYQEDVKLTSIKKTNKQIQHLKIK